MSNTQILLQKIEALPPDRLAEIEDFVDFLGAKTRRLAALDRLLSLAGQVEAAGFPEMTMEEINQEVAAVRAERRARQHVADHS